MNWYEATAHDRPDLPPLDGDIRADVCVVGAGFTGLGAAMALAPGVKVVVLEAGRVGGAATGRNGGQVHTGQRRDQAWLETAVGRDDAMALWRLAEDARANFKTLTDAIACRLDPGEQVQAAAATEEVTRGEEVGATANWTSATRENVSGSSTVASINEEGGGRKCMNVNDFIIVDQMIMDGVPGREDISSPTLPFKRPDGALRQNYLAAHICYHPDAIFEQQMKA